MDDVEKRVEYLEMAKQACQANPPASKKDVKQIWEKWQDMENCLWRNNVRFSDFPEGKEGAEVGKFLEELLSDLLNIEGRREIEWTHRVTGQRPTSGGRPRPILAKFLRSSDRDVVLRAMRNKGNLSSLIFMLFPDYVGNTTLCFSLTTPDPPRWSVTNSRGVRKNCMNGQLASDCCSQLHGKSVYQGTHSPTHIIPLKNTRVARIKWTVLNGKW